MKPIILITVYNRFHELVQHLEHNHSLFNELEMTPYIIVVWASPKSEQIWLFEELINRGLINKVIYRDGNSCDNGPTTFPESLNLKLGFEYIKNNFEKNSYYIIGQAADIKVKEGTYKLINDEIKNYEAVLFFWQNGISNDNVWHTNFFAVKNLDYLPPVNMEQDSDVLETKWGKYLINNNLQCFLRSHNSRNKKFDHLHLSENLPKIKSKMNVRCSNIKVNFTIKKEKWYIRLFKYLRGLIWR